MQQVAQTPPRPSVSTTLTLSRLFSTCLCILIFSANALAVSLPASHMEFSAAISISHKLQIRQQTVNLTAYYVQACGENFVDCGDQKYCCKAGQECVVGSQSGDFLCHNLSSTPTSAPSSTSPPSSSSSSSKAPIGAIVGGALGAVGLVAAVCIVWFCCRRRHPPTTPAIPQAPVLNLSNVIEAKYPPPNDPGYSGDHWLPGSFLYHNRNRSLSTGGTSCVSPDGYSTAACENGYNYAKQSQPLDTPSIMELPAVAPTVELPGDDGYFASKPQPPPPPTPLSPTPSRRMSLRSPVDLKQLWRTSRGT
ncbi:hypothetical protein TWF694_000646 [Orbilia ellipsospora]|uniref:Uncharacterized protein n=1 Tax=Orbilia ellipsospora TaxID=2528407 RepID=A0AAV9XPK5_9PEZI